MPATDRPTRSGPISLAFNQGLPIGTKTVTPRLAVLADDEFTLRQRQLLDAMRPGPRGKVSTRGPLGIYRYSPDTGDLVQELGAHCLHNSLPPLRLSEFAILCTVWQWRAA